MSMQKDKTFVFDSLFAGFIIVKYLNYQETMLYHATIYFIHAKRELFDQLISVLSFLHDIWASTHSLSWGKH